MTFVNTKPPRVHAWVLGYYTALQDTNKALIDIPLDDLSKGYQEALYKRAQKETQFIVAHYKNRKKNKDV